MGFFSWKLDDGSSIRNKWTPEGATPVEMVTPDNVYPEPNYDGYGVFGGADYYALVDQMNGGEGDRDRGINLDLEGPRSVKKPRFRRPGSKKTWKQLKNPKICDDQGYW